MLFALAIIVTGCGSSAPKDVFSGTWQRQIAEDAAFDKAIEEIVIEKEKDAYFVKNNLWRYVSNACRNDNGKFDKDPSGRLICTFKLTQSTRIPKTSAELKGNTLIVKVGLGQIALNEKDGKIISTGFINNKEHTYTKKDDKQFREMLKEHFKTISTSFDIPKAWIKKEDNSILDKK